MEREEIAKGFVHWARTFNSLSKEVSKLSDLSDGVVLFEICAEIDRQWFKSIRSMDIGDNWILNYNNLKKLYRLVTQYYEEVLGYPATHLEEPNLSAIAKNDDIDELLKLCHLILTLAVQCEKNQVYIGKIMSLGEDDQRSLMVSIESVLAQLGSVEADSDPDGHDMDVLADPHGDDVADPVARLQAELMKSYAEKDELEKSAHELSVEHKQVQNKYEELLVLNEELKMRMEDLEHSMAKADKTGKADFLLRAEIENLKHDLEKAEMRNQDSERLVSEHQASISELNRKLNERGAAQDEVSRLRDQLQEYKHAAERLAKSEHVIEKYKKKLEESADLRRQVRSLEEQLAQSQDQAKQVEEEYRRVSQLRPTMDSYRDEYANLESRHNLTVIELSQAMERLRKLESEKERLAQDRQRDQEQISSLEEALHELELGGAGNAGQLAAAAAAATAPGAFGRGLASEMDSDDRPTLLTKLARLERELESAKQAANKAPSTDATEFLEEVADAANSEKEAAIKQLHEERELRMKLERDVSSIAEKLHSAELAAEDVPRLKGDLEEVTEQLVASSIEVSSIKSELASAKEELEKARASSLAIEQERKAAIEAMHHLNSNEVANLRDETKSLEDWYTETHQQSKEFKAEVDRLSANNRQLTQQLSKLQEDITRFDLAKRELEFENARLRQAADKQRASLASSAQQYVQSDFDRLQKELVKSRDEVHMLQVSLKRTKDHCMQLDQKLKHIQDESATPQEDYREALQSMQSQLAIKDEQLESMRTMLREQNNAHLLESRTMASAWFNLQRQLERQLERQSGFGHSSGMGSIAAGFGHSSGMGSIAASSRQGGTPASWLGQQRVTLDMQLGA
ncbi:hypothetical protein GGI12_001534 [Dipsacomyces acuminosporus]|nr:hypothetical protein GGI12_001534 [Dipsacomyces acuminosporus]